MSASLGDHVMLPYIKSTEERVQSVNEMLPFSYTFFVTFYLSVSYQF